MTDSQVEKLDQQLDAGAEAPKLRLDADDLRPRDLRRARDVLGGRNPWELLDDPIDRVVLTIWCLLSRDDPSFTWEQAEDTPFGQFETAGGGDVDRPPPATSTPASPGTPPAKNNGTRPKASPRSAASTD